MAKQTFMYYSLLAIVIFWASFSSAQKKTLTVELIHRDSPCSPLYNPLHTVSNRLNAAFLHLISRSRYFSTKTDIQSGLIGNSGDYYMAISIGTLATKVHAIADTGSDLTWIQYKPTVIGCGYNNVGTFAETGSGIVDLRGGPLSLISQLVSSLGKKFLYCLSHTSSTSNETSFLNLGTNSIPYIPRNGSVVLTTPLVTKAPNTYYYITLEAITIGNTKLPYTGGGGYGLYDVGESKTTTPRNIIIDSGTTFTFLESGFYGRVVAAVEKSVIRGKRVSDPQGLLPHCSEDKRSVCRR
ncbi:unnamed protein product [Thlaspi arvense]|uniref:Peptidase A1 domain-containing protein n=1 Tax=Thlaspi arvense TaxID=13288 RepID=A0AAU9RUT2_THLAR|nr:unnamed protein product [Thlaspi arvense]